MNNLQIKTKGDRIYSVLKDSWLPLTPEEKLRQEFIIRLVEIYDYSFEQLDQDVVVDNGENIDIGIWKDGKSKKAGLQPDIMIMVVCKAEHIRI